MNPSHTITSAPEQPSAPGAGQPHLFLTLRCDKPLEPGARVCLERVDEVTIGRADSFSIGRREDGGAMRLRIGIPDPRMSSSHARLQKVLGAWVVGDAGSKNGTWVDGTRVTSTPLNDGALLEIGHTFLLYRTALPANGPGILDGNSRFVARHAERRFGRCFERRALWLEGGGRGDRCGRRLGRRGGG